MTSSSDSLPKTEKYLYKKLTLDSSNYSQWATGFKMWASGLGLWPFISGDEKLPSPPAQLTDPDQNILRTEKYDECVKLYKQRRLLALSALSTAIDAQDFIYLRDTEDPNIGWEALARKYLPQKAIWFNQYLDWLFTIPKAHNSNSIAEMLQSPVVLRADLTALSVNPSDIHDRYPGCSKLGRIQGPQHYLRPYPTPTALDFNNIVNRLKTQELHHISNGGGTEHDAMFSGHWGN
ncbi:hypothetical protein F4604DRAFT_1935219 [Suillus subluteus]|nr:hypothetical protein F4604DRAFT_1935219 [Suillus subluteus]